MEQIYQVFSYLPGPVGSLGRTPPASLVIYPGCFKPGTEPRSNRQAKLTTTPETNIDTWHHYTTLQMQPNKKRNLLLLQPCCVLGLQGLSCTPKLLENVSNINTHAAKDNGRCSIQSVPSFQQSWEWTGLKDSLLSTSIVGKGVTGHVV